MGTKNSWLTVHSRKLAAMKYREWFSENKNLKSMQGFYKVKKQISLKKQNLRSEPLLKIFVKKNVNVFPRDLRLWFIVPRCIVRIHESVVDIRTNVKLNFLTVGFHFLSKCLAHCRSVSFIQLRKVAENRTINSPDIRSYRIHFPIIDNTCSQLRQVDSGNK